jgi:hypothetical protein
MQFFISIYGLKLVKLIFPVFSVTTVLVKYCLGGKWLNLGSFVKEMLKKC